ncbi:hypothetical protein [Nostoc sp. UHCC 0251]|uniref:hypothetical protein n=1 Tax=Nostoc sp. UHCC 0251 TaxID=3110240 RepID=UPI002B20A5CC|nr:hypothetical protein [Nostoc sp. UHCC 0251]MEA5624798.1 hypothetical protein [Nostoc sp. UHCC 0251]
MINNADLDAASVPFPREQTYPPEYTEAIAQIKEQHQQELERLSQEIRIGLQTEAIARAEEQVQEQIQSLQRLFKQQKEENMALKNLANAMNNTQALEAAALILGSEPTSQANLAGLPTNSILTSPTNLCKKQVRR